MKGYTSTLFLLSICGVVFSGYLSITRMLTDTCALSEPCPYFLGYPACYFGFVLFLVLAGITGVLLFGNLPLRRAARALTIVSGIGVLFAGRFTVPEVVTFLSGRSYTLGLPTCAYGLVFFVTIFVLSFILFKKSKHYIIGS